VDKKTEEGRFLRELYELAEGQATRAVNGKELARRLGMDLDEEADRARFSSTARRLEEEGRGIANKTGASARDYSSLSMTYGGIRAVEGGRPA
jgi:hypothetical protein